MHASLAVAIVATAACGRVGFDRVGPDPDPDADRSGDAALADAALVDAADATPDAPACPAAPAGCTRFACAEDDVCYYACTPNTTWTAARDACPAQGIGCLVTIDDMTENTCVSQAIADPWIGYQQQPASTEPAGGWTWQCGTSPFVAWRANEPNDQGGTEDCAVTTLANNWVDKDCSLAQPYICELRLGQGP